MSYEEKLLTPELIQKLQQRDNTWKQDLDPKKPLSNTQLNALRLAASAAGRPLTDEQRAAVLSKVS